MFCTQCGYKLDDGMRFCPRCGASVSNASAQGTDEPMPDSNVGVVSKDQADAAGVSEDAPARKGLASRLIEFRRTTLKAVPTFAIIIAVMLIFAGTAYAAYRVAVDVVIPMVQEWSESLQTDEGSDGDAGGEENAGSSESEDDEQSDSVREATGQPESILQVAEILAMDPEDIPMFLGEQGLVEESISADLMTETGWRYELEDVLTQLEGYGIEESGDVVENLPYLALGTNCVPMSTLGLPASLDGSDVTSEELSTGERPNAITLYEIPLASLTDGTISQLCDAMGVDSPQAVYGDGDSEPSTEVAFAGLVAIDDEPYLWYVDWNQYSSEAQIGCVSLDIAQAYVADQALYSDEEWENASETQQAGMFAQALLEEHFTGNGGTRLNLRTGETEYYVDEETGWIPLDEAPAYVQDAYEDVDDSSPGVDFTKEEPSQTLDD